jgi:putative thioredoxin
MSQDTPYIFDATSADFDQLVIQKSFLTPVLVDFWAEWCAPCKAMMPVLKQITEGYQGELLLAKVDCDAEQDIVARFGIRSLPTVVLFKDGQPVDGFSRDPGAACAHAATRRCRSAGTGASAVCRRPDR